MGDAVSEGQIDHSTDHSADAVDLVEAVEGQVEALLQSVEQISQQLAAEETVERNPMLADLQATMNLLRLSTQKLVQDCRQIQDQRQHYWDLFEYAPAGYLVTDLTGRIRAANRAAIAYLGLPHQELIGAELETLLADEIAQTFLAQLTQFQENPGFEFSTLEMSLKHPQGGHLHVALTGSATGGPDPQILEIRWLLHDMTQRHLAERALQQLNIGLEQEVENRTLQVQRALDFESMLKRITDKVRDSLDESQILQTVVQELTLILNLGGCNAALYDLDQGTSTIRYECTDSIPTSRGRVAQMDNFPEIYRQLRQGYYFQFCSLMPNPERGQVALLACPIFVDPNSSEGMDQAVLGDLWLVHHKGYVFNEFEIRMVQQVANQCAIAIRQARLYQAAQVQVKELEKLNRLKDEFLSTVSHELRTPISNVKMAIHMLKNAPSEERRQRYLAILEAESSREAELINDLLDLQRLEATSYPIELKTKDLQKWLPSVVDPFQSRIANHRQQLRVDCPPDLQPLSTDFNILRRILAELLNNACKYTAAEHEIILSVYRRDASTKPSPTGLSPKVLSPTGLPSTVLEIRNQADIPPAELPHIFEKFYRVPHADPWKQGGTGLGLALVQKLIEQLSGTIAAESADGWTTFTVQIPSPPTTS